jgi:hypothetical protein
MPNIIKINDELLMVRRTMSAEYEVLGPEWNKISPLHKTFKQGDRLFFCEIIEEAEIVEEVVENPTN